jgi:hypothetical protein
MFIVQQPNKSRNEECPASALGIIIFEVAEFKHQLMTCLGVLIYSEVALFYSFAESKFREGRGDIVESRTSRFSQQR